MGHGSVRGLTVRQREVLEFINSYLDRHPYPPSVRELSDHFSISIRAGHDHLKALQRKGFIVRSSDGRSRTLEVLDNGSRERRDRLVRVPILGRVAAGTPIFAEENFDGTVGVAEELLDTAPHFALRVQGDSMRDAGILEGDTAIVRRQKDADSGDIVVAMIKEEAITLKRFYRESNRIRLQAENSAYPPIFTQNLRILGKLRAIQRCY